MVRETIDQVGQSGPLKLLQEDVITLRQAARQFPKTRRPHTQSLWRWARYGLRGTKLESLKIGHQIVTSKQAVTRFIEATQSQAAS